MLKSRVKIIDGDILDSEADAILHQVNCQGVMGSGVAKQIRDRYPSVYEKYKIFCQARLDDTSELLGDVQLCAIDINRFVVNLFAQDKYGRGNQCYTNYDALKDCLKKVNLEFAGKTVAIPYMMSCGRGGGDWNVVSKIIEEELKDCNVTLYKFSR